MPTKIEWADETWNPVTGCTKVSAGCANCYAETMAGRFAREGQHAKHGCGWDTNDFRDVLLHPDRLDQPLHWRKPRRVFVCSMGDLFHEDVAFQFIDRVLGVAIKAQQHQFLILTKRPGRMRRFFEFAGERCDGGPMPLPNVWLGVSVEDQKAADERIPILLQTPAAVRFVSVEPMLGAVDLGEYLGCGGCGNLGSTSYGGGRPGSGNDLCHACTGDFSGRRVGLDWVICGGESGPKARPMHPDWARGVRDQCIEAGVPFNFKQWGEWAPDCLCHTKRAHRTTPRPSPGKLGRMFRCGKKNAGRLLDGELWDQYPKGKS